MLFYRRRLPHLYSDAPIFLTWCLYGSFPSNRPFPAESLTSGEAFVAMDRFLHQTRTGSFCLRRTEVAEVVVEALRYNERILRHYDLHTYVVMPNHVHVLLTPLLALPKLTKSIKGITAKRANQILGSSGPFWQHESYDHLVRSEREFTRIRAYIELNPVQAGLCARPEDFLWSSAATRGSPADQGVRPTST